MSDPYSRGPRTFLCRDALWENLERIATELECSVDYLVNDALKHYIRQRLTRRPEAASPPAPLPTPVLPSLPLTPSGQYRLPVPPPLRRPPPPPPPPLHLAPQPVPPPPLPARLPPPALPPPVLAPPPARAALTVTYAGATSVVDRPGFVIGRGKAAALVIKDPNISRQHAIVEQQGGLYYLVDMGSINGTFVNGERVTRKAIADGDVAVICEHEVRFAFSPRPGSPGRSPW